MKFTLNDSIKVKIKCWLSLVSYFFAVPSRESRERRENKADLVQFKLELTPNHQKPNGRDANGRDALIGRFEWTRVLQIPLV